MTFDWSQTISHPVLYFNCLLPDVESGVLCKTSSLFFAANLGIPSHGQALRTNSSLMAAGENERIAINKIINFAIGYLSLGELPRLMLRSNDQAQLWRNREAGWPSAAAPC